jgi:hypothetical protein
LRQIAVELIQYVMLFRGFIGIQDQQLTTRQEAQLGIRSG